MFLAKETDNKNLLIYISLFERLAQGKEIDSLEEIKDVIINAKDISEGNKDIFSAPNDYFHLTSYLLSNGKQFLRDIERSSINEESFEEIADKLSEDCLIA
jgi:hypothetical protein